MTALLPAILVSSVLGSLHCIAMCGPLVGIHGGARSFRLALVHSLGRLTTYVVLGMLAGGVGRAIDVAGDLATVQRAATIVAGVVIVGWGLVQIAIAAGWLHTEAARGNSFGAGLVAIRRRPPALRAWLAGTMTGLLPCGWLWAFVVAAAGTGGVSYGGLVMATFWLGTVPAMVGVLAVAGPTFGWLRARMPIVTSIALIVLGLGTLALRWNDTGQTQITRSHCPACAR